MIEQQKLHFDTMEQFELNIPKVATDSENYEDKKDIKIMAS